MPFFLFLETGKSYYLNIFWLGNWRQFIAEKFSCLKNMGQRQEAHERVTVMDAYLAPLRLSWILSRQNHHVRVWGFPAGTKNGNTSPFFSCQRMCVQILEINQMLFCSLTSKELLDCWNPGAWKGIFQPIFSISIQHSFDNDVSYLQSKCWLHMLLVFSVDDYAKHNRQNQNFYS